MKSFLLTLFVSILWINSFCQKFTYDGFLIKGENGNFTNYPVPISIENIDNEFYEIKAYAFEGQLDIRYIVEYDQYDGWEELYLYKGNSKKSFDGDQSKGGKIELTTITHLTSKHKLSDFANGLNININTINEDFHINVENKTTRTMSSVPMFKDVKTSNSIIVPYLEN